jgi:REP element-mobilizing transposase RayT
MPRPIVIAYHLIWTGYGRWLPNDPRGSTSRTIASDPIAELGELHYGRRKIQPPGEVVREFYERAEGVLKFPLLEFNVQEIRVIAEAFSETVQTRRYTCYACAIMPDHVHLLIRKHKYQAEQMIEHFQSASRLRLSTAGACGADHPVWTRSGWKGFVDRPDAVRKIIGYVENNPPKMGLPRQRWPFVKPYDGWPLHAGHDPNSPYARRLREDS